MRSKTFLAMLTMVVVVLLSSGTAQALKLHNFDCAECHKANVTWTSVDTGNLCLQCHGTSLTAQSLNNEYSCFWDGTQVVCADTPDPDGVSATPTVGFSVGDASNKLGSNGSPGHETSHNWGARIYNPRAGSASNPADPMYNSTNASRNASGGYVTCFRCHDPHGAKSNPRTANNKLLRLPGYDSTDPATMVPTPDEVEVTCTVCHADWAAALPGNKGLETHPIVTNYSTFVDNVKFKAFAQDGEMQMLNGNADMGCTTCHGLHFADSKSGTPDVPGVTGGDGALLRANGAMSATGAEQSSLCQSCHIYSAHPGGNSIGCTVCHSGHSYNDGDPNYYMLRNEVASLRDAGLTQLQPAVLNGPMTGMNQYTLSNAPTTLAEKAAAWGGTQAGVADGYCEACHGDLDGGLAFSGPGQTHATGQDCTTCHSHADTFVGAGCTSCHGFAPEDNTAGNPGASNSTGYAFIDAGNNYLDTSGVYKAEASTPHASHAKDTGNYGYEFPCERCHNSRIADAATTHNNGGTYQNVLEGAYTFTYGDDLITVPGVSAPFGANYYDQHATIGTCDTIYCHSNGGTYRDGGKIAGDYTFQSVTWAGQKNSIIGAPDQNDRCSSCHGNSVATMAVGDKDNSQTHNAHLNKGYTCNVCHNTTATSNTVVNIAGGQHVDSQVDLDLDNTYELSAGNAVGAGSLSGASCSVYCHSDGAGTNSTPDWATAASGQCGTCHSILGTSLPDAHARHLSDSDGPQATDCSVCHTHNGTGADHVNGVLGNVDYTKCRGCHGTDGTTGNDADLGKPEWVAGTASCETCHIGVTSTITQAQSLKYDGYARNGVAPAKNSFIPEGHGDTGLGTPQVCTNCHADLMTNGHFDSTAGDDLRLQTLGATTYGTGTETAWCQECHTTTFAHFDNARTGGGNSDNGHQCAICHEPHGEGITVGFDAMLKGDVGTCSDTQYFDQASCVANSGTWTAVAVTGFIDRTDPTDYFNGTTSGVCQVCHDQAEVNYYHDNSIGGEASGSGHNAAAAGGCISCHAHSSNPAFQGGDCFDCHGDAVSEYWPQSVGTNDRTDDAKTDFNDDGRHTAHVTAIAAEVMGQTPAELLTDNAGVGNVPYDTMSADAKQKEICSYCHVVGDGDHSGLGAGMADVFSVGGKKKIWDASNDADASFTTVNFSCSTVDCHDSKTTTDTVGDDYTWYGVDSSACIMCHDDVTDGGTADTTGSTHVAHTGAATNYGIDSIDCTTCHDDATVWGTTAPATGHRDGSWTTDFTYSATYPATGGNCGTTVCHNDGTAAVGAPVGGEAWATDIADPNCGICHAAPMATAKHTEHIGNDTFLPVVATAGITDRDCDNCHGTDPEEQTTHIDAALNFGREVTDIDLGTGGNQVVTPGGWNGTCTNNCHLGDTANDWSAGGALVCVDCHNTSLTWAPGSKALTKGWPGGVINVVTGDAAHDAHVSNSSYVTHSVGNFCVECHNDNNTTHSPLNGVVTLPTAGTDITVYTAGNGTCTNSCHGGIADFTDSTPAPLCIDCHSGIYIGGDPDGVGPIDNRPLTGLHATSTAMAHDVLFDTNKTCTNCHQATPSAAHMTGVLQNPTQTTFNFDAGIDYVRATGCQAAACHSDGGDWRRKWLTVEDAVPLATDNPGAAVCKNCHGDFSNTWNWNEANATTTDHSDPFPTNAPLGGDQVEAQHGTCQVCHGWGSANYDRNWGAPSANNGHGDGLITMNGPDATPGPIAGAQYIEETGGCAAACHVSTYVMNDNSGWAVNYGDFGSGDCAGCHSGNGVTHGGAGGLALHSTHNANLYIDANANFVYGTSGTYDNCNVCHGHNGAGGHNNGTVEFSGAITSGSDYGTLGNFTASDNCTNTCHANAANDWANASLAGSCNDCHDGGGSLDQGTYPPSSDKHALHNGATASLVDDCNACHGATANTGGQVGHVDTNIDLAGQITAGTDTCTNNCHNLDGVDGTNGNTDDARWQAADTDTIGCADCHNKASNALSAPIHASMDAGTGPITGKHSQHVGADASYVGAATCTTCHTHSGALSAGSNGHVDGTNTTLDGSISYTAPTCTNACHVTATGRDWSTGTLNCIDCHTTAKTLGAAGSATMSPTVAPNTGRHTVHMASNDYVPNNCTDCHGHSGVLSGGSNGHVDGADKTDIGVASQITVSPIPADDTCTNNCHDVVDGRDWTVGATVQGIILACADCHAATGKTLAFGGGWTPTNNAHAEHLGSNALPNATDQNECYVCHGTTVGNTGDLSGNSTHINDNAGDLSFANAGYRYRATNISTAGADGTTTCSSVKCHNGDTTPQWNAGSIACGDCHGTGGPLPSDTTARSHSKHANNDATYTDCDNCHGGITANISTNYTATGGAAAHQNLTVDLSFDTAKVPGAAYADGDGADGVNYSGDFTDDGTCSSVECHFNNGTPAWGGTISDCVSCHNNGTAGTTIEDSQPNSGWHVRHVEVADQDYVADCTPCHGASDGSHGGHGQLDGPDFAGAGTVVWDSGNNTCANACHVAANGDWDEATVEASQTGSLGCTDCHSQATKLLNAGGENDLSATTGPNAGRHDEHMAINNYVPNNCTDCHGHVGPLGIADGHVDGPDVNTITMDNATGKVTSYTTPGCVNQCHTVTTGPSDGDWVDTDPLTCTNCHNTSKLLDAGGDPWTSVDTVDGKHGTHAGAYTYGATGQSATGAGTTYNFGCGECHAGTHLNGTLPVTIADVQVTVGSFSTGDKSCGTSDCHNDGTTALGAPAATGNGNLNWGTVFTGDRCNKCHGNIPNSGAHTAHQVGIHWEDVYTGTTGLLTAGTEPSGHGGKMTDNVTPTSTVINCQVCHFNTVQDWYNDKNSTCATSCHNGTDVALQGDVTIAQRQNHITGSTDDNQAEVTFFGSPVRSKAQLRNDIEAVPEIGNNWKRMNDSVLQNLFYKGANAYDETEALLNTDTYTGGATPTCTTQCHNGNAATWVAPTGDCSVCHTQLPQ